MRDFDETNLGNRRGNSDPFVDIEHINVRDEYDDEMDLTGEARVASTSRDQKGHYDDFANPRDTRSTHKKTLALSHLSKRTLLVSLVVLIGFAAIFMWSWIFEVLGFISGSGTPTQDKSNTQIAEIITLPAQDSTATQLAMAPSPVQSHARSPKVTETIPSSLPEVSRTTNAAQGISTGGTNDHNKALTKDNVPPIPKKESKSELKQTATFEPRLEARREAAPLQDKLTQSTQPQLVHPETNLSEMNAKTHPQREGQNAVEVESSDMLPSEAIAPIATGVPAIGNTSVAATTSETSAATTSTAVTASTAGNMDTSGTIPLESVNQMRAEAQAATQKSSIAQRSSVEQMPKAQNQQATSRSIGKQETLLLNRKPENYTIQILGMQDEHKLKAFMNQSILKSKMSSYKTHREGKDWHVIVYGDFATKQQAEEALLKLPQDILKNKPWIRTVRDVQGAIRADS